MKKNIIRMLMAFVFCFSFMTAASAQDNSFFLSFFDKAIQNDSFYALDNNEEDITDMIKNIYQEEGVSAVYQYMFENCGAIGFIEEIEKPSTRALEDSVTVSNSQYTIANGDKLGVRKEWRTKLIGTYYVNSNTGLITRSTNPSLSLEWENFGSGFSPYLTSISTSSYITNQSYVTFKATYTMKATYNSDLTVHVGGMIIDFGSHTHMFTAS